MSSSWPRTQSLSLKTSLQQTFRQGIPNIHNYKAKKVRSKLAFTWSLFQFAGVASSCGSFVSMKWQDISAANVVVSLKMFVYLFYITSEPSVAYDGIPSFLSLSSYLNFDKPGTILEAVCCTPSNSCISFFSCGCQTTFPWWRCGLTSVVNNCYISLQSKNLNASLMSPNILLALLTTWAICRFDCNESLIQTPKSFSSVVSLRTDDFILCANLRSSHHHIASLYTYQCYQLPFVLPFV